MQVRMALALLLLVSVSGVSTAQPVKKITNINQTWVAYFNQVRLSNKWGIWVDAHLRTKEDFVQDFSQSIVRVGGTYYLRDAIKLTAGYAYVNHFPADAHKHISQPEHRPWQQIQWHNKYRYLRTMQWLRLEERYRKKVLNDSTLGESYNFNFRLRYNFLLQVPLSARANQRGTWSFILNDELHVNMGKEIVYNTFDQNRFFVGFAYHVNEQDNLQFGYMNVYQQLPSGNQYRSLHTPRIYYFHNLDLRRK